VATRALQSLYLQISGTGKLSAVATSSPANKYIALSSRCVRDDISDTTPRAAVISADEAVAKLSVTVRLPGLTSREMSIFIQLAV
jgi:predicted component of type VI protein secretion system